jgi:sarcosine oxidase subunit beta
VAERAGVLIVGGGIVGTALAWALAERGVRDVVVVDLDLAGVYASSELNAGGARATWWQPVNIEACRSTLDFFRAHADEFGFRERGYLWLYEDEVLFATAREKLALQNGAGLGVELLAPSEVQARFPILDRGLGRLLGATFSPRDGLVNPNAVRAWFRREARARGVVFRDRDYVLGVHTERVAGRGGSLRRVAALDVVRVKRDGAGDPSGVLREILTAHRVPAEAVAGEERIACDVVVNCLGAWSSLLLAKLGVPDVTEPVRRQIALVDVHREDLAEGVALATLGMIVLASGLYFHPEGPHVLAGYSTPDEAPGYDFDYDGREFFEGEIWPRLAERASSFERCGHVRGWAGLYDVTPDRSGIAGAVRGFANLYEAHSFTGRGVMQSYGIACGMAALITTGAYSVVDLSALTRERFDDPRRWVTEDLHI